MDIDYSCSKIHCKFNEYGLCTYNDEEFIGTYLAGRDINDCHIFEAKDGYCECGCELRRYVDKVEYWGSMVDMETWECPRCD